VSSMGMDTIVHGGMFFLRINSRELGRKRGLFGVMEKSEMQSSRWS
jgi:hypothetical protein